jgi:hypothetical protein
VDETVIDIEGLKLEDDRRVLSPPWLAEPLYQCATAVTVLGFVPHSDVDVEVDGTVVVTAPVEFPEPVGATLPLPAQLVAGQTVRGRQHHGGVTSGWSPPLVVRDHTADFPAGPPRPQINPAPVHVCGSRTGVGNLLGGGSVWITADGAEVGRVNGCAAPQQGVNVNPSYGGPGQRVRAHFELCGDPSAPSLEHLTQPGPVPLPAPGFDPVVEGGEQLRVTGIANGARVSLVRNGTPVGTYRCWGFALFVNLAPAFTPTDSFGATQQLCPSDPPSPPGTTGVLPCSSMPAPTVGPVQAGDTSITIVTSVPGAQIRVYRNGIQVGLGAAPVVGLAVALVSGDIVHVVQSLLGCSARLALQLTVACVDPPFGEDPSAFDVFPVSSSEYSAGPVKGSVYYPADDDGTDRPFNRRLAAAGRVPIVVMAHGNHSPADPSYLGYDYFQHSLAKMGMVAVSVDCNALNGAGGGVGNIEDRADLIIDSIKHFQALDANPGSVFHQRIDFGRLGLMGHSRGGDAVVTIPTVIGSIGVTIRAVLALAPTNFRYWFGMPTIRPAGYAFMTILPAADGDVVDNNGAQFYDQASPDPYKSQLYVHSTNHNFFNRQWIFDDGVVPVLARASHERILDVYGCALFRSRLLGHPTHRFLDNTQRPTGAHTAVVRTAYMTESAVTVDNHDDGNTIAVNSLVRPTSQSGGMTADEYPFDQVAGAFNGSFFGLTVGMVMEPKEVGAVFRSEIGREDVRDREVWLRVAEVVVGPLPQTGAGFELGLEDGSGTVGWISSDAVGGVPRPFERPDRTKTMLSTLRFMPGCARPPRGTVNLEDIRAILIRETRRDLRVLAFDDLQLVKASREV